MREREVEPTETRAWTALLRTHDVEDLTQEVFIKISEALPGFGGECALSTWVFRIARNVAIDNLTNSEIAAVLGISVDTVKIRLHRARCELRRVLGEGCTFDRDQRNELACQPSAEVGRT
jgi:DNA-directed RNA polymerase specialized sigma24 family protein